MSAAAVIVNIGEMIDLAIGTPEVGVVDFNMLQTVLHCMAQQMRIVYKNVELRGSLVTDLPDNTRNVQTVAINEFLVTTQDQTASTPADSRPGVTFKEVGEYRPAPYEESILVVERVNKTDSPIALPSPPHVMPGAQGVQTSFGVRGAPGSYGHSDAQGTYGLLGAAGSYGPPGEQSSYRPPGAQGSYGPPGEQISYGPSGTQGNYGPPGTQDHYGLPGKQGSYGPPGAQGTQGPPGTQGTYGPSGAQGSYGPAGEQGSYGPRGAQGTYGPPGEQGSTGPPGGQGSDGPPGEQGSYGLIGAQGIYGPPGEQGSTGPPGAQGVYGSPVAQGTYGPPGQRGAQGPPGTQDPAGYGASDSLYPYGPGGPPGENDPAETGAQDSRAPDFYVPPGAPGFGAGGTQGMTGLPGTTGPGFYGPPGWVPTSTAASQKGARGLPGVSVTMGPAHYVTPPGRLSVVTLSKFNMLENIVVDLQKRVYGSIPNNEEILEEVRSQTNLKSITDMWTSLNVSARLEAAEIALVKLSSLVQELIKETDNLKRQATQLSTRESAKSSEKVARGGRGKSFTTALPSGGGAIPSGGGTQAPPTYGSSGARQPYQSVYSDIAQSAMAPSAAPGSTPRYEDLVQIYDNLNRMQCDIDRAVNTLYSAMDDMGIALPYDGAEWNEAADGVNGETGAGVQVETKYGGAQASIRGENTGQAQQEGADKEGQGVPQGVVQTQSRTLIEGQAQAGARGKASGVGERQASQSPMKRLLITAPGAGRPTDSQVINKINDFERKLNDGYNNMAKRYEYLMDQIKMLRDKVEMIKNVPCTGTDLIMSDKLSPDIVKDLRGLMQLFKTVQEMQVELAKVHSTALNLVAEKEDRQQHIDALLEQIELLKNCKMDRDDIAEVMAEKADMRSLARKVSHDQFEIACDDLARGLELTIGKLNQQEALWQQALDDIQREIESKLDKMELSPMKDFFNNKLKQLQENLKQMAMLRREAEAAGTKRRLLRDVNCISCDAKAVMAMDPPITLPSSKPLPANMSMKPYLSYELDAIRKSQATSVPQRNMHDWEVIDKAMAHPKALHKVRSETDKHLCNRYCGGSHTTTTPTQRVARLGHFVKQWGPDVMPLSSGLAAGDDGKMYKVIEAGNMGSGNAPDATSRQRLSKQMSSGRPSTQSKTISTECRCMDGDVPLGKQQGK